MFSFLFTLPLDLLLTVSDRISRVTAWLDRLQPSMIRVRPNHSMPLEWAKEFDD